MAGHGSGVAKTEVDVVAAVNVGEMRAAGVFYENRESAGPLVHPVHGNATEQRSLRAKVEFGGARMFSDEAFLFALMERVELSAVDVGHVSSLQTTELA